MAKQDTRSEEKLHRDFGIRGACGDFAAAVMVGTRF